jgi:hypothetical protein
MAGALKRRPQASGTVEKRNQAAHGASTESLGVDDPGGYPLTFNISDGA